MSTRHYLSKKLWRAWETASRVVGPTWLEARTAHESGPLFSTHALGELQMYTGKKHPPFSFVLNLFYTKLTLKTHTHTYTHMPSVYMRLKKFQIVLDHTDDTENFNMESYYSS